MVMKQIEPIKKEKVSEAVFKQLLQLIKSGQWEVGYKLPSENKLCSLFNVSRVSVRTALHKLEALGLLETRNGEGTFVQKADMHAVLEPLLGAMTMTEQDIIDILEFRRVIEQACVKNMAANHTDKDIEELAHCLDQMRRLSQTDDAFNYSTWDMHFHRCIVKCSGNQVMAMIYDMLYESIFAHLYTMNTTFGFNLGLPYHEKQFEAIVAGEGKAASIAVVESLNASIEQVNTTLKKKQP